MASDVTRIRMRLQERHSAWVGAGLTALYAVACMLCASCGRDGASPMTYVFTTPDGVRCEWWINGEPVAVTRSASTLCRDAFLCRGTNVVRIVASSLTGQRTHLVAQCKCATQWSDERASVASIAEVIPAGRSVTAMMTFVASRLTDLCRELEYFDDVTALSDDDTNTLMTGIVQAIEALNAANMITSGTMRGVHLFQGRPAIVEPYHGMCAVETIVAEAQRYSLVNVALTNVAFLRGRKLVYAHANGHKLWEAEVKTKRGDEIIFSTTGMFFLRYTGEWLRVVE